ncbi:hypothetical protein D3C71_1403030 [compost metagenome]
MMLPMNSLPALPSRSSSSSRASDDMVPRMPRKYPMTQAPAGVCASPRPTRSNSGCPSANSSSCSILLAADWVMFSCDAAARSVPRSSMASNSTIWRMRSRESRAGTFKVRSMIDRL